MHIFVDTSVIIRESFFRSPFALSFFRAAHHLGIQITVSQVVLDEIVGRYKKSIRENYERFEKIRKEVNKVTQNEIAGINVELEEKIFFRDLDNIVEKFGFKILPYPNRSARDIVKQSYRSRKPFNDKGEGYKDYLIWESLLSFLETRPDAKEVFFLTGNVKDFCESEGNSRSLHHHLREEIADRDIKISIFADLKTFFNEKILPKLKDLNLQDCIYLDIDELHYDAVDGVNDLLTYYTTYGFEGLPFSNDVTITRIHNMTLESQTIKEIDEDTILVSFEGTVEIEVDGYIEKNDYLLGNHKDLALVNLDWNESMAAVSQTIETPFLLQITYSKWKREIIDSSIVLNKEIE